jgi:hypothetical protein
LIKELLREQEMDISIFSEEYSLDNNLKGLYNPAILGIFVNGEYDELHHSFVHEFTHHINYIHSPVKIAGSNIWLETNRSASDIRRSILVLLERYGEPVDSVKVYFRRDYAALHAEDDR